MLRMPTIVAKFNKKGTHLCYTLFNNDNYAAAPVKVETMLL